MKSLLLIMHDRYVVELNRQKQLMTDYYKLSKDRQNELGNGRMEYASARYYQGQVKYLKLIINDLKVLLEKEDFIDLGYGLAFNEE